MRCRVSSRGSANACAESPSQRAASARFALRRNSQSLADGSRSNGRCEGSIHSEEREDSAERTTCIKRLAIQNLEFVRPTTRNLSNRTVRKLSSKGFPRSAGTHSGNRRCHWPGVGSTRRISPGSTQEMHRVLFVPVQLPHDLATPGHGQHCSTSGQGIVVSEPIVAQNKITADRGVAPAKECWPTQGNNGDQPMRKGSPTSRPPRRSDHFSARRTSARLLRPRVVIACRRCSRSGAAAKDTDAREGQRSTPHEERWRRRFGAGVPITKRRANGRRIEGGTTTVVTPLAGVV